MTVTAKSAHEREVAVVCRMEEFLAVLAALRNFIRPPLGLNFYVETTDRLYIEDQSGIWRFCVEVYNDEGPGMAFTLHPVDVEGSRDFGLDISEGLLLRKGFIDSADDCGEMLR